MEAGGSHWSLFPSLCSPPLGPACPSASQRSHPDLLSLSPPAAWGWESETQEEGGREMGFSPRVTRLHEWVAGGRGTPQGRGLGKGLGDPCKPSGGATGTPKGGRRSRVESKSPPLPPPPPTAPSQPEPGGLKIAPEAQPRPPR